MRRNFLVPWAIVALLMVGAWTSRGLASPLTQPTSPPSGPLLPPVATELIGQIGGATYALDSSGPYVYLGVGPRVLVLDVTDPAAPQQVGQSAALPTVVQDVQLSGSLLIVALGEAGVQVLDVSTPAAPTLAGRLDTSGDIRRLALAPGRIYATDSTGSLQIIGLTDADHLTWLGAYPGQARQVAAVGTMVYLLRGTSMLLLDAANPANPVLVGAYQSTAYLEAVTVINGLAYLAAGADGMEIVSVTDPAAPAQIGHLLTPGASKGIAVDGAFAYLAADQEGLQVVDIQDAAAPTLAGSYAYAAIGSALRVSSGHAFVSGKDQNLVIVDVSQPAAPVRESSFDLPAAVRRTRVDGTRAYLADADDGLWIMDITDPANPAPLGLYRTPESPLNVTLDGSLAYVAVGDSGLQILDVTDPGQPTLLGSYDTIGYAFDVAISNTLAYVADGPRLSVINVSQPATPTLVTVLGLRDARSVDIVGDLMYVADFRSPRGLRIFSLANPAAPLLLATYPYDGAAGEARVRDGVAYIAQTVGLETATVISPTAPARLASMPLPGNSYSLALAQSWAFVACGSGGLQIVDVSDPAQPLVTGLFAAPGSARGVDVQNDLAYVAADTGGLIVVRITPLVQASPWFFPFMRR